MRPAAGIGPDQHPTAQPALTGALPLAGPLARPFAPAGSPDADCLAVLEAVTAGQGRRFPRLAGDGS